MQSSPTKLTVSARNQPDNVPAPSSVLTRYHNNPLSSYAWSMTSAVSLNKTVPICVAPSVDRSLRTRAPPVLIGVTIHKNTGVGVIVGVDVDVGVGVKVGVSVKVDVGVGVKVCVGVLV